MAAMITSLASTMISALIFFLVTLAAGEQVAVAMARHAARTEDLLAPCALGFPGHFGGKLEHVLLILEPNRPQRRRKIDTPRSRRPYRIKEAGTQSDDFSPCAAPTSDAYPRRKEHDLSTPSHVRVDRVLLRAAVLEGMTGKAWEDVARQCQTL